MSSIETSVETEPEGFDLAAVVKALWHNSFIFILIIAVSVTGALAVLVTTAPLFQAQALVLLSQPRTALEGERPPLENGDQIQAFISSEMRYLTSDNYLLALIRNENLVTIEELGGMPGAVTSGKASLDQTDPTPPNEVEGQMLPILRSRLHPRHEGSSYVLSITVQSEDPFFAADLANAAAALYVAKSRARGSRYAAVLAERIATQLEANNAGTPAAANPQVTQRLEDRLVDLQLESQFFVGGASLLTSALVPAEPAFPKKKNTLVLTFILATGVGFMVVFWLEFYSGKLLSRKDLNPVAPRQRQFEFALPGNHLRRALRPKPPLPVLAALGGIDSIASALDNIDVAPGRFGRVLHMTAAHKAVDVVSVARILAVRLWHRDRTVAIVDLRNQPRVLPWAKRKTKAGYYTLDQQEDEASGALFYRRVRPGKGETQSLATLINELQTLFHDVLVIAPDPMLQPGSSYMVDGTDAILVVSELRVSKVKPLANLFTWLAAEAGKRPTFSLTVGVP